jgi:hypothetical protein
MEDNALRKFNDEIMDRVVGLAEWLSKRAGVSYGLAMVEQRAVDMADVEGDPMFVIDDEEFRQRAKALLPSERCWGPVLVVACLH